MNRFIWIILESKCVDSFSILESKNNRVDSILNRFHRFDFESNQNRLKSIKSCLEQKFWPFIFFRSVLPQLTISVLLRFTIFVTRVDFDLIRPRTIVFESIIESLDYFSIPKSKKNRHISSLKRFEWLDSNDLIISRFQNTTITSDLG